MARAPDPRIEQAKAMYLEGRKLVEIASQLNLPEGTVRRWKSTYKWEIERSDKNSERSDKKTSTHKEKKKAVAEVVKQVIAKPDLTDKQQLFCALYAMGDSATSAYQKAYECSYSTAMVNASKLLRNAKIRNEVDSLKRERFEAQLFGEHDIFQWYLDIATACVTDFITFGREEIPVMGAFGPVVEKETGEQIMKEVNYVKFKESSEVNGHVIKKVKLGKDGASIELYDAMAAMDWLANHMSMGTGAQQGLAQGVVQAWESRKAKREEGRSSAER